MKAFSPELCGKIIWEEVSTLIATESSGKFPPDDKHIISVIDHFKPKIIMTFGKIATVALTRLFHEFNWDIILIPGPHPAARGVGTIQALNTMRDKLDSASNR